MMLVNVLGSQETLSEARVIRLYMSPFYRYSVSLSTQISFD